MKHHGSWEPQAKGTCEVVVPLFSFHCCEAELSSNVKCTSFQSLLGAGPGSAWDPRLGRIPVQTPHFPLGQPPLLKGSPTIT